MFYFIKPYFGWSSLFYFLLSLFSCIGFSATALIVIQIINRQLETIQQIEVCFYWLKVSSVLWVLGNLGLSNMSMQSRSSNMLCGAPAGKAYETWRERQCRSFQSRAENGNLRQLPRSSWSSLSNHLVWPRRSKNWGCVTHSSLGMRITLQKNLRLFAI